MDQGAKCGGIQRSTGIQVIVEISINWDVFHHTGAAVVGPWHELGPRVIMIRAVFEPVKPDINEISRHREIHGHLQGTHRNMGGGMFPKYGKTLVGLIPRRMTELDRMPVFFRQFLQEGIQAFGVELKIGRQLPKDGAAFFLQKPGAVEKLFDRGAVRFEALDMRDEPAAFDGKNKIRRRTLIPALHHRFLRQPIKRSVDLDRDRKSTRLNSSHS